MTTSAFIFRSKGESMHTTSAWCLGILMSAKGVYAFVVVACGSIIVSGAQ